MRALKSWFGIDGLGAALLGAALLLPVGDAPWVSFWREWAASLAVLVILLGALGRLREHGGVATLRVPSLPLAAFGLAIVPWLQWLAGIESYRGDAVLVSAYLAGFGVCIVTARSLPPAERARLADRLAVAMLFAAACSAPLALLQWLGWLTLDLDIKVAAGRPVAHMEQTNLLCSLMIQGLLGAWRLRERRLLGGVACGVLGVLMLLVVDLTQSRVAWMVLVAMVLAFLWRGRELGLSRRGLMLFAAAAVVGTGVFAVPWVDGHLGLAGLDVQDRISGGRRPDVWRMFIDAAIARPWAGWGALQNGAAQFALAPTHPPLLWLFTSTHDIVLDLMVWFGIPIGGAAGVALIVAVLLRVGRAPDAAAFATALASMALLLHGLVELPLHYAYFLFPLGLMLGATEPDTSLDARAWRLPIAGRAAFAVLALAPALLLALLARDYTPLGDTRPVLVLDRAAGHASLNADAEIPDALLLDQLQAYHAFAAHVPASGIPAADIVAMRMPMLRFPFVPSQELYAHVVALNGDPVLAIDTLERACRFMSPKDCARSRRVWSYWRGLGEPLPEWVERP
ncbi:MAG: O-antigen ligase C-terminal domain-containing protein [Caulobacter sp.]|nr:O-antigen ligase C-terminal domain-containing protein [Vitreoscilla sp.]